MTRAMGLLRVSSASQVDGYSLDAQEREITRWCQARGYDITFRMEEGVSARTDKLEKRPQLQAIIASAERHEFDVLVVHTLDRFARNQGVQRRVLEALGKAGVGFATVMEGHEFITPSGKLLMSVMGAVNEFFSDQLGVHVAKAARQRVEIGLPVGPIPFGYRSSDPKAVPEPVAAEAGALLDIFQRRACGVSMGELASSLNDLGFITREGKLFTAHGVRDILENPFYHGVVRYRGEEHVGKHDALVSKEQFDKVQARRGSARPPRTVRGSAGLLQGMIACVRCGSPLQSDRHRFGGAMYRERHANSCCTNGRSSVADVFDVQAARIITSIELPGSWREHAATLAARAYDGPSLQSLQEKRRKLGVAFADDIFSDREYKARLAEIDACIREAHALVPPSYEEAAQLFQNIEVIWKEALPEEQRRLLSPLIERVYVDMEQKLVGAITPTPAFRAILTCAVQKSGSSVVLLSPDDQERDEVWSWWRRGGIEPPVQKKNALDLLQA